MYLWSFQIIFQIMLQRRRRMICVYVDTFW